MKVKYKRENGFGVLFRRGTGARFWAIAANCVRFVQKPSS